MDISVVVPIYNVEKYLRRCLESLKNQDFEGSYEVLLVNDGSTDDSGAIASSWASENDSLFFYFEKENGGLSDARNFGIKRARGEYVAFIDSDDYVEPCFISRLYDKAKKENSDIVVCSYLIEHECKLSRSIRQKGGHAFFGKRVSDEPRLMLINSPYAWNKLYRRSLFLDNDIYYPKGLAYEDIATTYPLMLAASRIDKVEEPLVHYISSREGSITGTFNERKLNVLPAIRLMIHRSRSVIDSESLSNKEDLENGIFVIAARHIYFRLRELRNYKGISRRISFIKNSFDLLDEEFPAWEVDEDKVSLLDAERINIESRFRWTLRTSFQSIIPLRLLIVQRRAQSKLKKAVHALSLNRNRRYLYAFMRRHCRIKENVALFESFHGNEISDSPRVLASELAKKENWKIYYAYRGKKPSVKIDRNIKYVRIYSLLYLYLLAAARLLVNSVSFPSYYIRRDGQLYINTWHGTPLKTLGKGMLHGVEDMNNIQRNFLQSTHLFFPDSFTENQMMRDYSLTNLYTGNLVECVYPRNEPFVRIGDDLIDGQVEAGKLVKFAFMPTWRGATSAKVSSSFADQVVTFLNLAERLLKDNQVMYVKLHSLMRDSIDLSTYSKVRPFPNDCAPYDFLAECEALVTDYSSVMFDFALSGKPVLLLVPDRYVYESERGTYLSVDEIPFPKYEDPTQLLDDLANTGLRIDLSALKNLLGSFNYVRADKILDDIIHDNEVDYIHRNVPTSSIKTAVICNGCRTSSDVERLKDYIDGLNKQNKGAGVVILLRAADFTDTLRNAIRANEGGLFDNFAITKGKEVRTYLDKLKEMPLNRSDRRRVSALRRLHRYFPDKKFKRIVLLDIDYFADSSISPVVMSCEEMLEWV